MNATTAFHRHHLGFPTTNQPPQVPARVVAPAPRPREPMSSASIAHVTKLLAALINVESSAEALSKAHDIGPLLREECRDIAKRGKAVNRRMLAEFEHGDAHAVTTLNRAGNALDRLALLLMHCDPDVADDALNAAADVIEKAYLPAKP